MTNKNLKMSSKSQKATMALLSVLIVLTISTGVVSWKTYAEVQMHEELHSRQDFPSEVVIRKLLDTSTSWDGKTIENYPAGKPRLSVLDIKIPANSRLADHIHEMPNVAYVKSGSIKVTVVETGESKTFHEGEAFEETVNTVHYGETTEDVELVVFYAGVEGQPLSQKR